MFVDVAHREVLEISAMAFAKALRPDGTSNGDHLTS
jgi:hypothetical protein